MSTTLTPPPASAPQAPPPAEPRGSSRVIAILAIALGAVLILGTIVFSVIGGIRSAAVRTESLSADAAGVTALDIDVAASEFRIAYGGSEATLSVTGGSGTSDWRLERTGDTLVVTSDRGWFRGWGWFRGEERAVLTLPERLATTAVDASFDVGAGSLRADGTYGTLELDLGAGSIDVSGTAEQLDADVSAGRVSVDLREVRAGTVQVSAGELVGSVDGDVDELNLDVSAGRIDLEVPDVRYAITSDVSAGDFTHDLTTDPGADRRIDVSVSAGGVTLHGAR